MYQFKYTDMNGIDLDVDGIVLHCPDGSKLALYGRESDGEISVEAYGTLVIEPRAANIVRVKCIK